MPGCAGNQLSCSGDGLHKNVLTLLISDAVSYCCNVKCKNTAVCYIILWVFELIVPKIYMPSWSQALKE